MHHALRSSDRVNSDGTWRIIRGVELALSVSDLVHGTIPLVHPVDWRRPPVCGYVVDPRNAALRLSGSVAGLWHDYLRVRPPLPCR